MDRLSAEFAVNNQITTVYSALSFSDALMTCENSSGVWWLGEGQCAFAEVGGRRFERDTSSDNLGFEGNSWHFTGGWQGTLDNDWVVGGALRYEARELSSDEASG